MVVKHLCTFRPLAKCSYSRSGSGQKQKLRASSTSRYWAVSLGSPTKCVSVHAAVSAAVPAKDSSHANKICQGARQHQRHAGM